MPHNNRYGKRDWRLDRLRHILRTEPMSAPARDQRAFVMDAVIGHFVIRRGVPNLNARESWHLRRGTAEAVAAAWNEVLRAR